MAMLSSQTIMGNMPAIVMIFGFYTFMKMIRFNLCLFHLSLRRNKMNTAGPLERTSLNSGELSKIDVHVDDIGLKHTFA